MNVLFLGTGEAFGERANTSVLIDDKLLVDCGLTTLQQLMRAESDLNKIKAIYVTHFHADHCFSLPSFLVACKEESRKNTLNLFASAGAEEYIHTLLDLAYKKTVDDLGFKINFHEAKEKTVFEEYILSFAPMKHSIPCMAVSIEKDNKKITYTGDGEFTSEATLLAKDSDLLIAEAYKEDIRGHSSIIKAAKMAKKTDSKKLALVHIYRKENVGEKIMEAKKIFFDIFIPEDLSAVTV